MVLALAKKIFGTRHEREIKRFGPIIDRINALEAALKPATDADLKSRLGEQKLKVEKGASLEDVLPDVFALVREASVRILGMRHFDVQLMGGITLHEGNIAEMKTGEGKTLAATLAVSLNALQGKGVHVVTVNDYLARRDAEWMGKIYNFLGLSVGVIIHDLDDLTRKAAYHSDITYGTNNEFGFDYLRDNMKLDPDYLVQRDLHYAIVDEVDSILIDEARTPLIISGPAEESTDHYVRINRIIPILRANDDYTLDEKARTVTLTEESGIPRIEKALSVDNLFDIRHAMTLHHVNQALRAHVLFKKDIDYVVQNNQVIIVDEFTGRLMPGRRWGEGLHQAIEAKENVAIQNENQTLASITFQNYFRMYKKLSGMTGTAETEAEEFQKIYRLAVMAIPTNMAMIRNDLADQVYKTERAKVRAVLKDIQERHKLGQPVLVGTISIEKSELLSEALKRTGIKHNVLNAKHHEREAEIVAQAGRLGAVTISTNMAGRGTDIMLGGNPDFMARARANPQENPEEYRRELARFREQTQKEHDEVVKAGGLHIIGTERHESRRIDNQLRGRSGRQGDPGSSRFYLSLEDDLMRIFASDLIKRIMEKLNMEEDMAIEHLRLLNPSIERAQSKVEAHNFDIRKHILEYDDVMNQQRHAFYSWRQSILKGENIKEMTLDLFQEEIAFLVEESVQKRARSKDWDWHALEQSLEEQFAEKIKIASSDRDLLTEEALKERLREQVRELYVRRESELTTPILRHLERVVSLQIMDQRWKENLLNMDHLREGIGLRGYAQKDPRLEYKREGRMLFMEMEGSICAEIVRTLFRVKVATASDLEEMQERQRKTRERIRVRYEQAQINTPLAPSAASGGSEAIPLHANAAAPSPIRHSTPKVGRNDPCPCGSGKKYKKCHGA